MADFLAIGVNGVDLFFVISGFCMYYFYASKSDFSYHDFFRFLLKRWVRLSPAFYAATILFILDEKYIYHHQIDIVPNFLHNVFYLTNIFRRYVTANHFWTLTVEWQFYFTIPLLLIYKNRFGFKRPFLFIFGMISFCAAVSVFIVKDRFDPLTGTLLFHGTEFGCGVFAARLLTTNKSFFKHRIVWLLFFISVTYTGRVLVSKSVLDLSVDYYNLFKLLGFTMMGAGFAGILYLSVTSAKWLNAILGNKLFKNMGRISYSFYLLHPLIYPLVAVYVIELMPNGIIAPILTTLISAIILYPVSLVSYSLLEKPFLSIGNLTTK